MIGFISYLVPGALLLLWTSWRFQRSLRNIVEDFTGSSSFLLLSLGGLLILVLWPLVAISWLRLKRGAHDYYPQSLDSTLPAKTLISKL